MDHHVCRPPPLGISVLIIGTRYNAAIPVRLAVQTATAVSGSMASDDVLLNAGKEQGEVIAAYLIRRMHEGRITPTEAVNVVAAHVEKQGRGRWMWQERRKRIS